MAKHAEATAGCGMAVGAEQRLPGVAEPLAVDMVRNAVAGTGIDDAEFRRARLQETVVVGVAGIGLDDVMVHVTHRAIDLDARQSHGFEFEIGHGPGGVLRQRLVDAQADLFAGIEFALDQMGPQQLFGYGVFHLRETFL